MIVIIATLIFIHNILYIHIIRKERRKTRIYTITLQEM